MRVGIMGLGLIGGSMAKAYRREEDMEVFGWDLNPQVTSFAILSGAVHGELTKEIFSTLDLLLLAAYPGAVVDNLRFAAPELNKNCLVIDLSGIKKRVCDACFRIAEEYGFTFVGGHPMAGTHNSGFKYARETLFDGAPMIVVPRVFDDIALLERVRRALSPARFGRISAVTAEEHDRRIAFTSQMPHVVSNAFIKSPTVRSHDGFSAGSYKDMTRVAWLNPDMWAELFMENRENLLFEMDCLINELEKYRDALKNQDLDAMRALLDEGKRIKEEVDGH